MGFQTIANPMVAKGKMVRQAIGRGRNINKHHLDDPARRCMAS